MNIYSSFLNQALTYNAKGFSVIPVLSNGKKPLIQWQEYQKRRATEEEIKDWWQKCPTANVGIVTGSISGFVVLDVDGHEGKHSIEGKVIPDTPYVNTGKGIHYYFKYPGWDVQNFVRKLPGIDFRGEGGFVVVPPSIHSNGREYEWGLSHEMVPLAELPAWVLKLFDEPKPDISSSEGWVQELLIGVSEGGRNDACTRLAGHFLGKKLKPNVVERILLDWNKHNKPPLSEKEISETIKSIVKAEKNKPQEITSKNQADELCRIAEKAILFHNELQEPFAVIEIRNHSEIHALNSKIFRRWLIGQYYATTKKAASNESYKQALNVLETKACFDGNEQKLELRVAKLDQSYWYDLSDQDWRAVKISAEGWDIINKPPILFRRYNNMAHQCEPQREGDISKVLEFVNLRNQADKDLFLVYIVTCLIPGIPHPIPVFFGEKGAAKSTALRVLRKLIDPAHTELLILPNNINDLTLMLNHNYMPAFDNLDTLSPQQSDIFCTTSTGGVITKRELYTNEDEVFFSLQRCVTLNGINSVVDRPDLLDRAILFEVDRISPETRRVESEFWLEFEQARPHILGGIFDCHSKAMGIYSTVKISKLPRMADFCKYGYAIAEAIGVGGDNFLDAYYTNIGKANEEAITANPVAAAVVALMDSKYEWAGTATELLNSLEEVATEQRINTRIHSWPKSASVLSRRLKSVNSNLSDAGITCEIGRSSRPPKNNSLITLKRNIHQQITSTSSTTSTKVVNTDIPTVEVQDTSDNISTIDKYSRSLDCGDSGACGDFQAKCNQNNFGTKLHAINPLDQV